MEIDQQIRAALTRLAEKVGPSGTILGKIKSVNEGEFTCVVTETIGEDELDIPDVMLRPVLDGNEGLTLFPKANTWALAIRVEGGEDWMLLAAGEYDKVKLKIGTAIIEQDSTGLLIKKGNDTLKQVIQNIIEATQQIVVLYGNNPDYGKLTTALTKLNNILR